MGEDEAAERLVEAAVAQLRQGDGAGAKPLLERAIATGAPSPPWLLLAQACLLAGDEAGEDAALAQVLTLEPRNLRGLLMRGDWHHRVGSAGLATRFYDAALRLARAGTQAAPDVQANLRRAEERMAAQTAAYEAHLRGRLTDGGHRQLPPRMAEAIDILMGRAQPQPQAPTSFFYPGLAAIGFHPRADFPWLDALEAQAPAIRAELAAAEADSFAPYVTPDPGQPPAHHKLVNDPRWSALHLWQHGAPKAAAARFPQTLAAVAATDQAQVRGRFPNVMFSRLSLGTRIPPHSGLYNTRLIVHLALVAPPGAHLRCGNRTCAFEEGRAFVFDDSMEHEAWNDAASPRTILLFDIWRPDLGPEERAALTALFEGIADYGVPVPTDG